jgi:predicted N-acyltransferase
MGIEIRFSQSAFKHGVSEADIRWAFETRKYDAMLEEEGWTDKHLLIGFDRNADLIEVMYNDFDDCVRVFHAMKCRNIYKALLVQNL